MSDLVRAMPMPATMKRHRRRSGKLVLSAIADDCDHAGEGAYPGRNRIASESEVCPRTVDSLLTELTNEGLIAEQAPPRQHPNRPRTYRINLERVRGLASADAWHVYVHQAEQEKKRAEDRRVANSASEGRKFGREDRKFGARGSQDPATDPSDPVDPREGTGRASTRPFRPTPKKASLRDHYDGEFEALTGKERLR